MRNSLLMKIDTSYALNFMIYIQNIYLNQNNDNEEFKFPYYPSTISFKEDFEWKYRELWDYISQSICDHQNDLEIYYEKKELIYQSLFLNNSESLNKFNEIVKSFDTWWDSFAGRFSIEGSIDERSEKVYFELSNLLIQKGIEPQKTLSISLIYDECMLDSIEVTPYFAMVPIRDYFIKYKQLVPKLKECIC